MRNVLATFLFLACAANGNAQTTVPFTFSAGSPARASEVNGNFQALVNALNSLTARVAKLEGQITGADLAGSYTINGLQTGLIPNNRIETIAYTGTLILRADATYSFNLIGNGFDLPIPGARELHPDSGNLSGTWSLTGTTVTLQGGFVGQLAHAVGGRVLTWTGFGNDDGSNVLLTFVRSN
jgi:hypothetical protein